MSLFAILLAILFKARPAHAARGAPQPRAEAVEGNRADRRRDQPFACIPNLFPSIT